MALQVGTLTATLKLDKNKFQSDMLLAKKQLVALKRQIDNVANSMSALGSKMTMGVTLPIVAGAGYAVKAWMDQEAATNAVGAALAKTGDRTRETMASMDAFASAMQKQTIHADDAVLSAMAYGKNLGINTDQLQEATRAAIGLSARYNIDLQSAMKLVGRAANGQTGTLARYGIVLDKTLSPQDQFNQLLKIGAGSFGLAQAQTKTAAGQFAQLKNELGDIAENVGKDLMPVIKQIAEMVAGLARRFNALPAPAKKALMNLALMAALAGPLLKLAAPFVKIGGWVVKMGGIKMAWVGVVSKIGPAIAAASGPVGWIVAGVIALGAAIVIAYKRVKPFREAVQQAWASIKQAFMGLWDALKKFWIALKPIVSALGQTIGKQAASGFRVLAVVLKIVAFFVARVIDGIGVLIRLITELVKGLSGAGGRSTLLSGLIDMALKAIQAQQDLNKTNEIIAKDRKKQIAEAQQAEIDAIIDVINKQRQAAEERRRQMREAAGWGSLTSIWENAMVAGARTAAGAKQTDIKLTAANAPTPKELREINANIKKQTDQQKELNDYIKRSLEYA